MEADELYELLANLVRVAPVEGASTLSPFRPKMDAGRDQERRSMDPPTRYSWERFDALVNSALAYQTALSTLYQKVHVASRPRRDHRSWAFRVFFCSRRTHRDTRYRSRELCEGRIARVWLIEITNIHCGTA